MRIGFLNTLIQCFFCPMIGLLLEEFLGVSVSSSNDARYLCCQCACI
jgi:hypothetical protein